MSSFGDAAPTQRGIIRLWRWRDVLDGGAILLLFLQASELYKPIGYLIGLPSSQSVNMVFMAGMSFYLLVNVRPVLALLKRPAIFAWTVLLVPLPVALMVLQAMSGDLDLERLVYWTVFSLLFLEMMLVAAVVWRRHGPVLTKPFFLGCVAAAGLAFAINLLDYGFVRDVMWFSANRIAVSDATVRMLGFYQHPNMAAISICLYVVCLLSDRKFVTGSQITQVVVIILAGAGIVLTGSRTTSLLFLVAIAAYALFFLRIGLASPARLAKRLAIMITVMAATSVLLYFVARQMSPEIVDNAVDRASSMLGFLDGSAIGNDESAQIRINILSSYWRDIQKALFLGRGPDFAFERIEGGFYSNVSQNSWIEWWLKFGLLYCIAVVAVLAVTYFFARRVGRSDPYLRFGGSLLLCVVLLASFSFVDIFWLRAMACAIGCYLGLLARNEVIPSAHNDEDEL